MPDTSITISEAAIDPKWAVVRSSVGLVLRIQHPRYGDVDCILLGESGRLLEEALGKARAGDA